MLTVHLFIKLALIYCSQDISHATHIAYAMVTQMGFSELLGDVDLDSRYNRLSPETKGKIENEVRRMVDDSRQRVYKLLASRRKELDLLANALVEYELLNLDEIKKVLKGEKLPKISATPNQDIDKDSPIKLPELELPPGMGDQVQEDNKEGNEENTAGKGDDVRI